MKNMQVTQLITDIATYRNNRANVRGLLLAGCFVVIAALPFPINSAVTYPLLLAYVLLTRVKRE